MHIANDITRSNGQLVISLDLILIHYFELLLDIVTAVLGDVISIYADEAGFISTLGLVQLQ